MWNKDAPFFHVGAWLLWLAAALSIALTSSNPFYLIGVIIVSIAVDGRLQRGAQEPGGQSGQGNSAEVPGSYVDPASRGGGLLLRAVVAMTIAVTLLKGLSLHVGATVIVRLPDNWPVIGGPVTVESMVFAATNALAILAVLMVFVAFSRGVDYYALLRSLPPFMHQVGLVTSIAITFVPQTVNRFAEVREAQALRGHRIRSIGDLLPVIMPLLAGGMERSMNLAEAMEARGFSRNPARGTNVKPIIVQIALAGGLGLILVGGGLSVFINSAPLAGWSIVLLGTALIGATLWYVGKGIKRFRYRRGIWKNTDTALAASSIAVLVFFVTYRLLAPSAFSYYPFPRMHAPSFDPAIAIAILCLGVPAAILALWRSPRGRHDYGEQHQQRAAGADPYPATGAGAPDTAAHTRHVRK